MENKKYCRKCFECHQGMNEGYVVNEGEEYYCSATHLYVKYHPTEWSEMFLNTNSYYTEWNVETDAEYELINNILIEIE